MTSLLMIAQLNIIVLNNKSVRSEVFSKFESISSKSLIYLIFKLLNQQKTPLVKNIVCPNLNIMNLHTNKNIFFN